MKILTIVGARPQFIKAVMVSRAMQQHASLQEVLVHTGQHYDYSMSDVFFGELNMAPPAYHLGIGGCSQGAMTGRMMEALEKIMHQEQPDWVLVYGDTNSTLAGALTAAKLHLPLAHVEAGLRSFNKAMPEEINRIVADHCATLLMVPTYQAIENLQREGLKAEAICYTGDVMYDTALCFEELAAKHSTILQRLELEPKQYVLATIHRAENTDHPQSLQQILQGLEAIAQEVCVVLPLHPRTRQAIQNANLEKWLTDLQIIDPVGYLDMVQLEKHAQLIVTDSGGVQKEAYFYAVPCLTARNETEWRELVDAGYNKLVGASAERIYAGYSAMRSHTISTHDQLYGDGRASAAIVKALITAGVDGSRQRAASGGL